MYSLSDAVAEYEQALSVTSTEEPGTQSSRLLKMLLARQAVSLALKSESPSSVTLFQKIVNLDKTLRLRIEDLEASTKEAVKLEWRETIQPSPEDWWWPSDIPKNKFLSRILIVLAWIAIAIALSFIVEVVKRFLSGGVDVASTVLQGLVALLVGGTAVQMARQVIGLKDDSYAAERVSALHYLLAVLFVFIAFVMHIALPKVASYYSDQGVLQKKAGHIVKAIDNYERSVSLKPDDSLSHYNLGLAYEEVLEDDKAESEYRAALRWDDSQCFAYNRLAHLRIARHQGYSEALGLTNIALSKLNAFAKDRAINEDGLRRLHYSLLVNRAWAHLGLKQPLLAQQKLLEAKLLRPDAAGAHCLLGQALNELKDLSGARDEWETCVADAGELQQPDVDAEWISTAQEGISRGNHVETVKDITK
jgi:tetratricopeptide (TPR) repeat protein